MTVLRDEGWQRRGKLPPFSCEVSISNPKGLSERALTRRGLAMAGLRQGKVVSRNVTSNMPQPNVSGAAVQVSFGLFSSFLATTVRFPATKIYGTNAAPSSRPPTYEERIYTFGNDPVDYYHVFAASASCRMSKIAYST